MHYLIRINFNCLIGSFEDLDKPDPEIDRIWAEEARKRWQAYKSGQLPTADYASVMAKHRRS